MHLRLELELKQKPPADFSGGALDVTLQFGKILGSL